MAKHLLALPEVVALLETAKVPAKHIEAFAQHAEFVLSKRAPLTREDEDFQVGSGYSALKDRAHVAFKTGTVEHQLDPRKAKQIGLWLIEASEAAIADHCVMKLMQDKVGLTDPQQLGGILLDLREIRQGTRDVKYEP